MKYIADLLTEVIVSLRRLICASATLYSRKLRFDRCDGCEVFPNDLRNVFGLHAGVPDVVRKNEDDRALLVAAGADAAEYGRRRKAQAGDLLAELLQELAATLGSAPTLSRRGADKDLSKHSHANILCRAWLLSKAGMVTSGEPTG